MGGFKMIYDREFPFDEIKLPSGDYFETVDQAMKQTGLGVNHVWSVTYDDHEDDESAQVYITGPSHHYCNLYRVYSHRKAARRIDRLH